MKEIIHNLFSKSGFDLIDNFKFGDLFSINREDQTYYWLVIQLNELNGELLNSLQDKYFDECKKIIDDSSCDKNT